MSLDHRLLDLLVCPLCKGALAPQRDADNRLVELQCPADRLGFPIRDGIAIMLEHEARSLDDQDASAGTPG
ncbi:MAG TPA: Trm112 family protein [Rubrivivax sp.]|nr:Trm112 family protein [Rubrivivax sp.]HPO20439.1 Trm112 family protein [Rubrivivax sp.]